MLTIVPIVEGDGDVAALPQLLMRILSERCERYDVVVAQGKGKVVKANGRQTLERKFDKFLKHAQNKPDCGAILVLIDSDDDCPVDLAQALSERCSEVGVRCPVQIVCARRSYESWFLASLGSIRGECGVSGDAALSDDAEEARNPKRWLSERMPQGQAYKETIHQASLSAAIDLDLAYGNSRSFRRLCHAVEQLSDALASG